MTNITTSQKFNKEMKAFIVKAIYEILTDPDFGLELSEKAKKRLRQILSTKRKTIPFSVIKRRYY